MIVEFAPGKLKEDEHDLAMKLYRENTTRYDIIHKYGTNRGIALLDENDKHSIIDHRLSGFYIIYGPKILGEMKVDLSETVPYYVGYAGVNNSIHVRIGRCVVEIMDKSFDCESHPGGEKIRNLLGKKAANLLSARMMPYDIFEWEETKNFKKIDKAWEKIETALVRIVNPLFNKRRV
jgi:hypothetical protein